MTANKLKLASLAFSRADREIYDCKQTDTGVTGFFKHIVTILNRTEPTH